MKALLVRLYRDENGFIVSAELILVATIAVLSMVVGLSEISNAVNQELEDVASAFGSVNQTYRYCGLDGCMGDGKEASTKTPLMTATAIKTSAPLGLKLNTTGTEIPVL